MFNRIDEYKKLTFTTYPEGNVIHTVKNAFDFDKGARIVDKYIAESEKFKKMSIKAQSDTSENETLSDSTLKITIEVSKYVFSIVSSAGFPNIAIAKALAQMTDEQLVKLQENFNSLGYDVFPSLVQFQEWVGTIVGMEGALDVAFKAHVHIHDSYTSEHVNAIRYIINSMAEDVEDKGNELVVSSDDPDLKNAITDLGMSTYFDIDIEE